MKIIGYLQKTQSFITQFNLKLTSRFESTSILFTSVVNSIWKEKQVEWGWYPPLIIINCCVSFIPPEFLGILLYPLKSEAGINIIEKIRQKY